MGEGERKLADFAAGCLPELDLSSAERRDFDSARVVLSDRRLLLMLGKFDRVDIPLTGIRDVGLTTRRGRRGVERHVASIVHGDEGDTGTTVVRAKERTMDKFLALLFKALLNDEAAYVKHPVKVGGQVVDSDWDSSRVAVARNRVVLPGATAVALDTVEESEVTERNVKGRSLPVLAVDHSPEEDAVTTWIHSPDDRVLNLLDNYIEVEYRKLLEEIMSTYIGDDDVRAVVALYSGVTPEQLPETLGTTEDESRDLLERLRRKGLLTGEDDLTSKGNIVASRNF